MNCFNELTYSIYADGELPAEETRAVARHLAECATCRALVEGLQAENRLLAEALFWSEEEPAVLVETPAVRARDILWTSGAVLAAALVLQGAWSWLSGFEVPSAADWLNPFSLTVQWNLFFRSLFYFIQEGATMLLSSIAVMAVLVLGLLALAAGAYWVRRRPSAVAILAVAIVLLSLASPARAIETRKGGSVTIAAGETLNDSLIAYGETIQVNGTITGNLIAFCGRVTINGTVQGDVITFSERLDIPGTVEGNVFAFAQGFDLRGQVGRTLHAFVDHLRLDPQSRVAQDVVAFAGNTSFDGTIARDLLGFIGRASISGTVERNVKAHVGKLTVLSTARIGGDLRARVKDHKHAHIDPGATIVGKTEIRLPEAKPSKFLRPKWYFWRGVWLVAAFATGLLLYWLFPVLFTAPMASARSILVTALWGFLALVAVPVAAIILAVTVVGLPISLISLATWGAGLYVAHVLVAVFLGRALLRSSAGAKPALAVPLLVGLVLVTIATNIPYIGGWVCFLILLLGLGMIVANVSARWRTPQPA